MATLDISVIVPFKNKSQMTLDCIDSLVKNGPIVKEILLVSNNSSEQEYNIVSNGVKNYTNTRIVAHNVPFNYQKINNWAVRQTKGRYILFLNNDTELNSNSAGLIERMLHKASEQTVGAVGCLLLFGDERKIQHAGVFLMPGGLADHLYVFKKYKTALLKGGQTKEYPYDIKKSRPLSAVTGAVTLVERKKFEKIGGFNENFVIGGGDVDMCLRLNQSGYQTWYIGGGYIIHKESQSRKFVPIPYSDFYWSYLSYIKGLDKDIGDPYLGDITKSMKA
jgi:GT2 family glycosyltransferase